MKAILAAALLAATLVSAQATPLNEKTRKLLTDEMLNVCMEGTTRRVKESGKSHITQADLLNACNCFAVTVSRNSDSKDHLSEADKQMISQTAAYCKVPYFGASDIKDTGTLGAEQPREGAMILTVMLMVVLSVLSLLIWIARKPGSKSHTSSSAANAASTPAAAAREPARQQEEEERQKAAARDPQRQREELKAWVRERQRQLEQDEQEPQKAAARQRARQQEEQERQREEAARERQRQQEEAAAREQQWDERDKAAARKRARQQEENERQTLAARKRQREQEEEERQKAAARKRQREQEEAAARKRQKEQEEAAARERARQQEEQQRRRNSSQGKLSEPQALEILGLNAGATKQEIRVAYNRLMKQVHPDVGGTNFFAKQLNEARETLCGAL